MTQMIEVKTAELIGPALDWVVDAIESGKPLEIRHHKNGSGEWIFVADGVPYPSGPRKFSTDWNQGGPLIERHGIEVFCNLSAEQASRFKDASPDWRACMNLGRSEHSYGPTPLIAAMRCLAAKLGEVVMVPAELVTAAQ